MTMILTGPTRLFSADVGAFRLIGTTIVAGSPDVPLPGATVVLMPSIRYPRVAAIAGSDAVGSWEFSRLRSQGYAVLALDPTDTYDPVAKAGLVPSPMPPDPAEHP